MPTTPGFAYAATAATGRLFYSSKYPNHGVGPGDVSAGDLWWLDVRTGQTRSIIPAEVVVEAARAPDGQNFAYLGAMPDTYELRWVTPSGQDVLLAKDVASTFSVSPGGDRVAFTRESGYNVPGTPGLYVVDVPPGRSSPFQAPIVPERGAPLICRSGRPMGRMSFCPSTVRNSTPGWSLRRTDRARQNRRYLPRYRLPFPAKT